MTDTQARAAYKQQPPPNDLPEGEKIPYIMLSLLYKQHSRGIINADTAGILKKPLMDYTHAPYKEKISLLTYFHSNLSNEPTRENVDLMVTLMEELAKLKWEE